MKPVPHGGHYVEVPAKVAERASLVHAARVRGTVNGASYRSSLNGRARRAWQVLRPSRKREHVKAITGAKRAETRDRRVQQVIDELVE